MTQDTTKWLIITNAICTLDCVSTALKKITLQNVCNKIIHNACAELVNRKYWCPPNSPIVAGPTLMKMKEFMIRFWTECACMTETHRIGQNVNQRKCSAHYAEAQSRHIRQNMLVFNDTRIIGNHLQSIFSFAQNSIDSISKRLLWIIQIRDKNFNGILTWRKETTIFRYKPE